MSYMTDFDYRRIFSEMKEEQGLGNEDIEFHVGGVCEPGNSLFQEIDGKFVPHILLVMTNDSLEERFRGSLRHELEHVKTGLMLINHIGLDNFVCLIRETKNKYATLAFKTISEYLSWKAACEDYESEQNYRVLTGVWQNKESDFTDFLDAVVAHYAYSQIHETPLEQVLISFPENIGNEIMDICKVVEDSSLRWPLTMDEFEAVGKELVKIGENTIKTSAWENKERHRYME